MSQILVKSEKPLDSMTRCKIMDIFETSCCPNESLIASIPLCKGICNGAIVIGDEPQHEEIVEY